MTESLFNDKTKFIEKDLRTKSIEELLFIYYNVEKYVFQIMEDEEEESLKLFENLKKNINDLDNNNKEYKNVLKEIDDLNSKIIDKEKNIEQLLNEKLDLEKKNSKQFIYDLLTKKIDEKYKKPKEELVKDFSQKKISFQEYIQKFKELGSKYFYYNNLAQQLEKV
jgi:hypothetical protein